MSTRRRRTARRTSRGAAPARLPPPGTGRPARQPFRNCGTQDGGGGAGCHAVAHPEAAAPDAASTAAADCDAMNAATPQRWLLGPSHLQPRANSAASKLSASASGAAAAAAAAAAACCLHSVAQAAAAALNLLPRELYGCPPATAAGCGSSTRVTREVPRAAIPRAGQPPPPQFRPDMLLLLLLLLPRAGCGTAPRRTRRSRQLSTCELVRKLSAQARRCCWRLAAQAR